MFYPDFHPYAEKLNALSTNLGIPTVFDTLKPLLHPASPKYQIIGVAHAEQMDLMAKSIAKKNKALIVHGQGLDEISCLGLVDVLAVNQGKIKSYQLDCRDVGLANCTLSDLQGGDSACNAKKMVAVLLGEPGGLRDSVLFNAAVALQLVGKVKSLEQGVMMAGEAIDSGQSLQRLRDYIEACDE